MENYESMNSLQLIMAGIGLNSDIDLFKAELVKRNNSGVTYTIYLQNIVREVFKPKSKIYKELLEKGYQNWNKSIDLSDKPIVKNSITFAEAYTFVNRWQARMRFSDSPKKKTKEKNEEKETAITKQKKTAKQLTKAVKRNKKLEANHSSIVEQRNIAIASEKSLQAEVKELKRLLKAERKAHNRIKRELIASEKDVSILIKAVKNTSIKRANILATVKAN